MFGRRSHDSTATTETVRGPSLARGPAWIVGLVLSAAGLALFFRAPGTPLTTSGFPDGFAGGETLLGFEANAWTAWITTAAGVLVLVGAAQHVLARAMSLIVGLGLGAAALLALIDSENTVLGLAATNGWTILGWGVASVVLLLTALLPRVTRERPVETTDREVIAERDRARILHRERAADPRPAAGTERPAGTDPADRDRDAEAPTTVQPAATTSDERSGATPPVRSEPLRHTYEPRTHESETTAAATRRADVDGTEAPPRR